MSQKRLVAVADVLGFTDTVLTLPLDEVIRGPVAYLSRCLRHSAHQQGWPDVTAPTLADIRAQERVGVAWFSDTILLYSLSDTDWHAAELVKTVAWFFFETFHSHRTRLRVGIDYDDFYVDEERSTFVGAALIKAYKLEEAQDWAGGAYSDAASRRITGIGVDDYVLEYDVPTKPDTCSAGYAVNWLSIPHERRQLRLDLPLAPAAPTAAEQRKRDAITRKWENTRAFHEGRCEICRLNERRLTLV